LVIIRESYLIISVIFSVIVHRGDLRELDIPANPAGERRKIYAGSDD